MAGMIRAVVPAWGELAWLAGPCLRSLWRRWRRCPTTVMTDQPDLAPEGADVHLLPGGWPGQASGFSAEYADCLRRVEELVVLALCADTFLLGDAPGIDLAAGYLAERPGTLMITVEHAESLEEPRNRRAVERWRGFEIVECANWADCSLVGGLFLKASLVARGPLLGLLSPGLTLAQTEAAGSERARAEGLRSVAVWPGLFRTAEISCRAATRQFYWHLDQLATEDREAVLAAAPEGIEWKS